MFILSSVCCDIFCQASSIEISASAARRLVCGEEGANGDHLAVGDWGNSGAHEQRAILYFDLASVPTGFDLQKATLSVSTHSYGGDDGCGGAQNVGVWKMTEAWTSGATWNTTNGSATWGSVMLGGSAVGKTGSSDQIDADLGTTARNDAYAYTTVTGTTTEGVVYSWNVTSLYGELLGGSTNNGLMLARTVTSANDQFFFGSATLTLSDVPEPGSIVLLAIGALGVCIYGWRKRTVR